MTKLQRATLVGTILTGIILRVWAATRGYNLDMCAFMLDADILDQNRNIYLSTSHYNYAPLWSEILHFLYILSFKNREAFRYSICLFLTVVDIGIFWILLRQYGLRIGALFFLNPISILITGYHSQFDNLAVLLGLIAVVYWPSEQTKNLTKRKLIALIVLGFSLIAKHLLFVFPLWLAVREKTWKSRFAVLLIPPALFLISFLPYAFDAYLEIISNVFFYTSWENAHFYELFVPRLIQTILSPTLFWIVVLAASGFYFRKKSPLESLLIYTGILVAVSPAVANQYLTIPVAFISAFLNPFFVLYTFASSLFILFDKNGLCLVLIPWLDRDYSIMIILLSMGIVWYQWRHSITRTVSHFFKTAFEPGPQ